MRWQRQHRAAWHAAFSNPPELLFDRQLDAYDVFQAGGGDADLGECALDLGVPLLVGDQSPPENRATDSAEGSAAPDTDRASALLLTLEALRGLLTGDSPTLPSSSQPEPPTVPSWDPSRAVFFHMRSSKCGGASR
ncbi:hypothetical protein DIPPA_17655 [Diplonema papillatum]|nr:hypothetical protein DIPPA_17655 [Diplonema papillatum]